MYSYCTERLLKNHFMNVRHHLNLKIQTRIMLKTKVILTSLLIGFLAFQSCHAFYGVFYRPMLSFMEKPKFSRLRYLEALEKPFLQDHLERRFGKVPATIKDPRLQRHLVSYATTTQATTKTTKTTTEIQTVTNPKQQKVKLCHFKTFSIFICRHYYSL